MLQCRLNRMTSFAPPPQTLPHQPLELTLTVTANTDACWPFSLTSSAQPLQGICLLPTT